MINRRDAIKRIGGMAGAAAMAKYLPGCGSDGGPTGITTYVYMMLENRSYDHYFGARSMIEGKPGDGLKMTMTNKDRSGVDIAPFVPARDAMCDPDPPHGWNALHASWNNGACDGFVVQHQLDHSSTTLVDPMQYLTREQLPITWALADAYTTCDRWFCSVMGPTLPNRAYWHAATSFGIGIDPNANSEILTAFNSVPVPTIYNRLHDKNVDWAYYYGSLPVVSLLGNPGPYQLDLGPSDGTGRVRRFGDSKQRAGQFFEDAAAGKLPTVSYIDPSFGSNDDHPPLHPILGQELIASVYLALAKSPQWKNTLLVITYDEHGGYFDHVPPPTTVDDTLAKFGKPGFEQLGFRVPTMVIGPYAKQSYISSVQYDHTSALKHLQNTFGLGGLTPRMDAANDLADCIDMDRLARNDPAPPIELPMFDAENWPFTDPACSPLANEFRQVDDPISAWAAAHPGAFGPYDASADRAEYLRGIHAFCQRNGLYR